MDHSSVEAVTTNCMANPEVTGGWGWRTHNPLPGGGSESSTMMALKKGDNDVFTGLVLFPT